MTSTEAIPSSMRVSVLLAQRELTIEEREVPSPGPDEVLVKIGSVGTCGSDVHYFKHGRIADYVVKEPLILGHEAGGTIVGVGAGVSPDRIGQRVALEPGIPCRRCRQCKAGRYNLCPDVIFFATPPVNGAFAEYVTLAADFAHDVPDTMSDDAAGLIEPLSVGLWACAKAGVQAGSEVLITGAGPIGIMTAQVARALGATRIVVSDVAQGRLEISRRYGATDTIDARDGIPPDLQVDSFIDCSGAEVAVRAGFKAVRPAGRVVLVGMGADEISLPVGLIQGRELIITGSFRYANTYPVAIAMAARGQVDLDSMVSGRFSLEEVEAAFDHSGDPSAMKAIVEPWR